MEFDAESNCLSVVKRTQLVTWKFLAPHKTPIKTLLGAIPSKKKLVPSKLNLQNGRKEMLRSIFMINKPTFKPERRRKFIHAAVIAWMKWTHKSSRELRFSTVFIKIQISLSVLMCCCLSNEWNAYDDDNSCLKMDEWSGVKHKMAISPVLRCHYWKLVITISILGLWIIDGVCWHELSHLLDHLAASRSTVPRTVSFNCPWRGASFGDEDCCHSPATVQQGGAGKRRWRTQTKRE